MMPRAVKPIFFTAYSIKDAMKKLNIPLGTPKPLFVDGPFTSRKEAEEGYESLAQPILIFYQEK
ncbi:MAG: hypothetical protein A3C58_03225 [Candidatus Staskawiczbacteria bacterium RIFCSPHIGHO2_02_FULL_34_10]|uniref:Uncharacterized protein n=2 Tax=Candidatus Staskawicziibacteriota TaxID=1817916 RepID=A0A1G2I037_9BACT|nr:MAG: hypothetical protein A3C58_03225 [Candidatus Staskawiczbacteria bacterium RIFCSPHIGHO2_02_FULL_34_10]